MVRSRCLLALRLGAGADDESVSGSKSFVFRFSGFEVAERELRVTRGGETLALEPKAFRVLLYLLRNPARLSQRTNC